MQHAVLNFSVTMSESSKIKLSDYYTEFIDIFFKKEVLELMSHLRVLNYTIDLLLNTTLSNKLIYNYLKTELLVIKDYIINMKKYK